MVFYRRGSTKNVYLHPERVDEKVAKTLPGMESMNVGQKGIVMLFNVNCRELCR